MSTVEVSTPVIGNLTAGVPSSLFVTCCVLNCTGQTVDSHRFVSVVVQIPAPLNNVTENISAIVDAIRPVMNSLVDSGYSNSGLDLTLRQSLTPYINDAVFGRLLCKLPVTFVAGYFGPQ